MAYLAIGPEPEKLRGISRVFQEGVQEGVQEWGQEAEGNGLIVEQ